MTPDMRRRASITDAELNRVLRAARKHGAASVAVDVKPDGWQATITLAGGENSGNKSMAKVAKREPIRLG